MLRYAKSHKNWTENHWKLSLLNPRVDGVMNPTKKRSAEKYNSLQPCVKHVWGSVMVWVCISANGIGDLITINVIMNVEKYHLILICHAITSGKYVIGNSLFYQHDNDLKHIASAVKV